MSKVGQKKIESSQRESNPSVDQPEPDHAQETPMGPASTKPSLVKMYANYCF